ncbi:hypothetical protein QTG54_005351 [Skeletonema marinoi]|uniref:Uncharacterized protein n=1 Tax=Skeletonema marinoi TaxID=267567 RepID=A0AAD8YC64_9STRA|nr:hypothetical protein QTG54_005351 [Skeletonema marinoi]
MMRRSDERKDRQSSSFDREAFRQAFMTRMENNIENDEWNRRRRWMSTASSSSDGRQPLMPSRPPLANLNNTTAPAPAADSQNEVTNERSRNISSIEISSPAKRKLWLLGQRYSSSSSSSTEDAQSVAGSSSSSSSGSRSYAGPVSPPSLRNKRIGKLDNYNSLQMLLLHANRHDNEVGSIGRDSISSIHEDRNTPVQGGHLLQLLNQLARTNYVQPTQSSPPRHLDVTLNSTDDDDGSSMLSNVSSFISPTQIFCADSEISEIGVDKCHQIDEDEEEEDSQKDESDYFSSFCKVQTILSELDQEENPLQSNSIVEKHSEGESPDNEDWGLLSCIALSILAVVSILIALSGLFSLQAKVETLKESFAIRLWETINRYETLGLEELKELHNWADATFLELLKRYETLYLNTISDLIQHQHRIFASFSLSKVTAFLMQQMESLGNYATNFARNMDVTSLALEQLWRVAKAYYSAIELFKTARCSFIELHASTALSWNTTLLMSASYWQQVGVTIYESKKWRVAPLSYNTQEPFQISKTTLTTPIIFDLGIGHYRNETIRYQEDSELEEEDNFLQTMSPPFWRRQTRAFIKRSLPVVEESFITQSSISHLENVGHSLVLSENLTALVVQRMKRNSRQPSKPKKKQRKVRDYYDSVIQQKQSDEKDVFDGVDVMSIASDAIVRWWHQHR